MFIDIVGLITTSKLSILKTFQGGLLKPPPPCKIGFIASLYLFEFSFFYK